MQIRQALEWAVEKLAGSDSASLDARLLLAAVLDTTPTYLFTWPEKPLAQAHQSEFVRLISLRAEGQPVAYLLGYRDFWSLTLKVSPTTLIPRPDTEILVEQALQRLGTDPLSVCDLGTGTGAIALAIASERPGANVIGVDIVSDAVVLATQNAQLNNIPNATFVQSRWFEALEQRQFAMIVSNPPYVEQHSHYLSEGDVRFEPASALVSGLDGLDDIRHIVGEAVQYLIPGGWLLIEHGFAQSAPVQALMRANGYTAISSENDLAGHPRVTLGQRPIQ